MLSTRKKQIREKRRELGEEQARLATIGKVLPLLSQIDVLEQELQPLTKYPATLDIDPEHLIELSSNRLLLEAEIKRLDEAITNKEKSCNEIDEQPELVKLHGQLEDFRDMRGRCGPAAIDLEKRLEERSQTKEDILRKLRDIGLSSVDEPLFFILDQPSIRNLNDLYQVVEDAKKAQKSAKEEESAYQAIEEIQQDNARLPEISENLTALVDVLQLHNATQCLYDFALSSQALRLAAQKKNSALQRLSLGKTSFEAVPDLPISSSEASILANKIQAANETIVRTENDLIAAETSKEHIASRIQAITKDGNFVTDEDAGSSRQKRDDLWQEHLKELSKGSAEIFEAAMLADDVTGSAQLSQSQEQAEVRQLTIDLAQADAIVSGNSKKKKQAESRREKLQSELREYLSSVGLDVNLSATWFAEWLRKAEAVEELVIAEEEAIASAGPNLEAAELLRQKLSDILKKPEAKLDALVAMADQIVSEDEKRKIEHKTGQENLENAKVEYSKRETTRKEADNLLAQAIQAFSDERETRFGDVYQAIPFPAAFDVLQEIRIINEKQIGLNRQITGMENDKKTWMSSWHHSWRNIQS